MKNTWFFLLAFVLLLSCNVKKGKFGENIVILDNAKTQGEENSISNGVEEKMYEESYETIIEYNSEVVVEYHYSNGNGTIINQTIENGYIIETRKHEQRFTIYPRSGEITAFSRPYLNSDELFQLRNGDYVNVLEVAFVVNTSDKTESNWIKILNDNGQVGWLDMDDKWGPYRNGNGAYLETIITDERNWTKLKLDSGLCYWETINIHREPGICSTILFPLLNPEREQLFVTVSAITKETDIINGITDYWVYIIDQDERTGWMFGGYGTVERGGPKYLTPENMINFMFNLP
jgi:hypothetical protein